MDRPDLSKSRVPELAISASRWRENGKHVDDDVADFLAPIVNSKVIEIMGGLGLVAEHLSVKGNTVKLVDEDRLFFVYRRQMFPNSKVSEINNHPSVIQSQSQPYDYAIIYGNEFLPLAKNIAKSVYNMSSLEIHTNDEVTIYSPKEPTKKSEDQVTEGAIGENTADSSVDLSIGVIEEQRENTDPSIPSD